MTNIRRALEAAAAGGGDPLYVEDVFSTDVWAGDATSQEIVNGIDLSGEGGLVWGKCRTATYSHILIDTVRGKNLALHSNATSVEYDNATMITAFNSDGYDIGSYGGLNDNTEDFVSWTFRKAPGFFDVVTYTGNGTASREISHNLGSAPGMMIIKRSDGVQNWPVYHRSIPTCTTYLNTNGASACGTGNGVFGDSSYDNIAPTSSVFTVGSDNEVNGNTYTYVAYLFAHDAQEFGADSDESIIKCGSYTTDGSGNATVSLGFEPQWVLNKVSSAADNWTIADNMRGFSVTNEQRLYANLTNAEAAATTFRPTSTGYTVNGGETSQTYIYIAIRRGPMKVPEAGTEVLSIDTKGATAPSPPSWTSTFPVDFILRGELNSANSRYVSARLTGASYVVANTDAAESANGNQTFDYMDGFSKDGGTSTTDYGYMFKRAPEFFDVVCYTGTGSNTTQAHNLGVAPEMIMVKRRNDIEDWLVYSQPTGNEAGTGLNTDAATYTGVPQYWNSTSPTASVFSLGTHGRVNTSAKTYVAYLFATLAGISKVGSYTADATLTTIDCGFSAGARFILIRRTDAAGDWYVYDSVRGIVAGDDPYFLVNTTAAQVTNTDYIDPENSGFQITAAGSSTINVDTGEYIFLAIA